MFPPRRGEGGLRLGSCTGGGGSKAMVSISLETGTEFPFPERDATLVGESRIKKDSKVDPCWVSCGGRAMSPEADNAERDVRLGDHGLRREC